MRREIRILVGFLGIQRGGREVSRGEGGVLYLFQADQPSGQCTKDTLERCWVKNLRLIFIWIRFSVQKSRDWAIQPWWLYSPVQHQATRRASACIAAQQHSRTRNSPLHCSEQRRGAEGQQADYLFQSLDGFPWERCTEQERGEHFRSPSSVIGIARLQQIDKLLIHPPPPVKSLMSPRPWAPRAPSFVETPFLPRAPYEQSLQRGGKKKKKGRQCHVKAGGVEFRILLLVGKVNGREGLSHPGSLHSFDLGGGCDVRQGKFTAVSYPPPPLQSTP
jgi:hypothetical protein